MPRAYRNILNLAHHDFHIQVGVDPLVAEKSVTLPPIKIFYPWRQCGDLAELVVECMSDFLYHGGYCGNKKSTSQEQGAESSETSYLLFPSL